MVSTNQTIVELKLTEQEVHVLLGVLADVNITKHDMETVRAIKEALEPFRDVQFSKIKLPGVQY